MKKSLTAERLSRNGEWQVNPKKANIILLVCLMIEAILVRALPD